MPHASFSVLFRLSLPFPWTAQHLAEQLQASPLQSSSCHSSFRSSSWVQLLLSQPLPLLLPCPSPWHAASVAYPFHQPHHLGEFLPSSSEAFRHQLALAHHQLHRLKTPHIQVQHLPQHPHQTPPSACEICAWHCILPLEVHAVH